MIQSIDELEGKEIDVLKRIFEKVENEDIAIAMHGLSPLLNRKIKKSLKISRRIKLWASPIKRTSVKMKIVEEKHEIIKNIANEIIV